MQALASIPPFMQDLPRLYCAEPLAEGAEIALDEGQARYLGTVLRRSPGDEVRLFNATTGEWQGPIARLHKGRGSVTLARQIVQPRAEPGAFVVFALLKRDATDLVVRLATELGVERIIPVTSRRTNAAHTNLDRLATIATEAAEQCERLSVPVIDAPRPLTTVLGAWDEIAPGRTLLAAIERPNSVGPRGWPAGFGPEKAAEAAVLTGPEGGFAPEELELLVARPFVTRVSLGPRILRAETAVAAGLARLSV